MKTEFELKEKMVQCENDITNLENLKNAAIDSKQFQVARDIKNRLAVRKRDRFIIDWMLQETEMPRMVED